MLKPWKLSSYDPLALRRGLRHIEALVAQLTLPLYADEGPVVDDEKLLDFLQLQDTFEWNGMLTLERIGTNVKFVNDC